MRILHITPDYYPAVGGAELHIKELSERLAKRGHDVTVLAMDSRGLIGGNGNSLNPTDLINGVTVKRVRHTYQLHERLLGIRGAYRVLGLGLTRERLEMLSISPFSLRALWITLRAEADVVAVINWYHGTLAAQACLARSLRDFALVGFPLFHTEREWSRSPLYTRMLERCDALAANTEHEKRFIEGRSAQRNAHVIGPGVDPARFTRADGRRIRSQHGLGELPVVGYVGRMSASKGVVALIEAMKIVWRADPEVRLLLAGSGLPSDPTCDDEIRHAFATLSEAERSRMVCISRFREDEKPSIFAALDVFAMVSVAESFGIAYLEAWMCRKPVIGSRIGSTECVIQNEVDGLLVSPADPNELATSIQQLLSRPDTRQQMGAAGYSKTLADHTWETVADRVEQLYKDVHAHREQGARRSAGAVA